jgi:serine/threonine-protein kinase
MQLGNYEPLLQLATGGMATVFVARQIGAAGFERLVVLKRVHPHLLADRDFYDMFRDEARVAAMLHHSNVVPVIDVVESEGELFLVMEYVDSVAFSTLMKAAADLGQRLPPAAVVRVVVDTLSGLHAAHDALDMRGNRLELVHRDVSPQNVIVGVDGSSRLIDFGVAKARHRLTETKSGSLKGKYGYMSPEQVKAQSVDRRADLFSAGVVLWEALTGARLFRGETEFDTIRRISEAPIPPPSSLAPSVPAGLDAVALKALARDREQRFQTAAEFLEALESAYFPAPARDVAAMVKAYCGERIDRRRATLEGMLAGRIEPLSVSRMPVGNSDGELATSPSTPSSIKRLTEGHDHGTESQIAATHDAPVPRRSRWTLAVVGGGAVAVVAVALALSVGRTHGPPVAASSSPPAPPVSVRADEVVLRLTADVPVEGVSAPGIHDAKVDGTSVRLVVARWGGELAIDAALQGGSHAHAVARSGGPQELHLETDAPASSQAASSAPPPVLSAPSARPAVRPTRGAATGRPPAELQANPYGQ